MTTKFHLSLPCESVEETKLFYTKVIGVKTGREHNNWVDIDLFGHQITFTKAGAFSFNHPNYVLEGKILPAFHFGVILDTIVWDKMYDKLKKENLDVVTEATFLKDKPGEHLSFFILDPNGYTIEFKSFKNASTIFKS